MGGERAVAAGLDAFLAELGEWAAARERPAELHAYGPEPDQHAELRLPDLAVSDMSRGLTTGHGRSGHVPGSVPRGSGPHPVAVVLHGGFWRAGYTRRNTEAVAVALAEAGWATWNVEYRRGAGAVRRTLEDVATARRALARVDAPLDLDTVVAVGHSAGGHLALWLAAERQVTAAVALAGVCDLAAAADAKLGDGAVAEFLGGPPGDHPDADPARRLPLGVPLLLAHGDRDDRVPVEHARAFASAAGDECRLLELDGADHFDVIDPRSAAWPRIEAALAGLT